MPGGVYLDLNDAFGKTDQFDFTIQLAQFRPSGIQCFHHSTVKLLRMERMQKKQMPNDRVFPSFQNDRLARRSTIEDDLHHSLKRGAVNVQKKLDKFASGRILVTRQCIESCNQFAETPDLFTKCLCARHVAPHLCGRALQHGRNSPPVNRFAKATQFSWKTECLSRL